MRTRKTMSVYVAESRKRNNYNKLYRDRYRRLKDSGFNYEEANLYKYHSDENITELIKKRLRKNYTLLIDAGYSHKDASKYKSWSDKEIVNLVENMED